MARNVKETDMTQGNILKHLILFALPLFAGNLIQQFYNLVDTIVVGQFVSDQALAAVGNCGSVNFLFFSLSAGLAIGIGVIASHDFGAKDEAKLKRTVANSFYVLGVASLSVTLLGLIFARNVMQIMQTPPEVLDDAVLYLRTTCCGILFIALYNGVAGILRAIGNSKMPLIFLIISSGLNIGFDLLFVLVFKMGVFGVAFATVVAQALSATISLTYAFRHVPYFRLTRRELQPDFAIIRNSFRLGVPVALQSSMIAISLMVLQGVVNSFNDTSIMSAFTITGRVDVILSILYSTLGAVLTTFAGQNFGAGKISRIKKSYAYGMLFAEVYSLVVVPLVIIFSPLVARMFTASPEIIGLTSRALRISTWFYFALGSIYIPRGVMNGCGDARFSLINGISEVACRIVYANILVRVSTIGVWGIWWACGLTWVTVAIICNLRYFTKISSYKEIGSPE